MVFSCEAEYNYVYINMFHENKTQKLHIVRCLIQFNWDDTIRSQLALDLWDLSTQNNIWCP